MQSKILGGSVAALASAALAYIRFFNFLLKRETQGLYFCFTLKGSYKAIFKAMLKVFWDLLKALCRPYFGYKGAPIRLNTLLWEVILT